MLHGWLCRIQGGQEPGLAGTRSSALATHFVIVCVQLLQPAKRVLVGCSPGLIRCVGRCGRGRALRGAWACAGRTAVQLSADTDGSGSTLNCISLHALCAGVRLCGSFQAVPAEAVPNPFGKSTVAFPGAGADCGVLCAGTCFLHRCWHFRPGLHAAIPACAPPRPPPPPPLPECPPTCAQLSWPPRGVHRRRRCKLPTAEPAPCHRQECVRLQNTCAEHLPHRTKCSPPCPPALRRPVHTSVHTAVCKAFCSPRWAACASSKPRLTLPNCDALPFEVVSAHSASPQDCRGPAATAATPAPSPRAGGQPSRLSGYKGPVATRKAEIFACCPNAPSLRKGAATGPCKNGRRERADHFSAITKNKNRQGAAGSAGAATPSSHTSPRISSPGPPRPTSTSHGRPAEQRRGRQAQEEELAAPAPGAARLIQAAAAVSAAAPATAGLPGLLRLGRGAGAQPGGPQGRQPATHAAPLWR